MDLEAEYTRQLDALYHARAEVVPAADLRDDYETLLECLGEWPDLERRFHDGEDDPEGPSIATWDAVRRSPAVRAAVEAIRAIERQFPGQNEEA